LINNFNVNDEYLLENSEGSELINQFTILDEDVKIIKNRSSAFYKTELDRLLRASKIKTVIIVGIFSYGCVLATCFDALFRGYNTVVIKNCIMGPDRTLDKFAKKLLKIRTDLISINQYLKIFNKSWEV